jgi:MFS family permease
VRNATKTVAAWFGIATGLAGMEHGIFEILQGNVRPESLMFASMGPPCVPEETWNACEPAMTVLPSLLLSGVLSTILGLLIFILAVGFLQRKRAGLVMLVLCIALLLTGGGLFPPVIGIIGSFAAMQINKSLDSKKQGSFLYFAAKLWPWPLVIFVGWVVGQWLIGYFFNDFLQSIMGVAAILILVMLPLSCITAYALDMQIYFLEKQNE